MLNNLDGHSYYPPEFVPPKLKETNDYGLQYAKAMYFSNNRYGGRFFYGNSDFDALVELAQGRQSVDNIRKLFGFFIDPNQAGNDASAALSYIDIKVLNLAPKYINRAVAKMQKINYDIGLQAIDLASTNKKEDITATISAYYKSRDVAKALNLNLREIFPDLDIDSLPDDEDEFLFSMQTNPKIIEEINGEEMIKLIHYVNRFGQKMREVDWDLAVIGRGHLYTYFDNNGIPRVRRINPKFWIGSYVENDDFEDQENAGFFDFITVNQFIKETSNEMTPEQQMDVVRAHVNNGPMNTSFVDYRRLANYDGLGYIPVLRFYYRSEDNRTFVKRNNLNGGKILIEKAYNYSPPAEVSDRFNENGDSKVIKNSYTSIYGGTWVVDSDVVYNYGRKNFPRQQLVNATLPIKTFAANFKEGRTVSFASQMIEPLYMANVAWNKIKQILAEGRMGVMEIDFDAIEDVAIGGAGGQKWTPLDVMKFFFKKNILIKRGRTNKHDQNKGSAIELNTGGLQFQDYMATLMNAIQMLEQMTGTTAVESVEPPDRLLKSVMEKSEDKGDLDMEYLYNAHTYLYERTTHQLLLMCQQALSDGKAIEGFIPALGKYNTGYFKGKKDLAYCEYGFYMTKQPSAQEWADFYNDVRLDIENNKLSSSDSAYLREIDNLKKARQMLVIRESLYEKKVAAQAQQNNQMAMESNQAAAESKMQADQAKIEAEKNAKAELIKLQGMIDQQLQKDKMQNDSNIKLVENQVKRQIANDTNTASVMGHALRKIPENYKSDKHAESKIEAAQIQSATAIETAKINASNKSASSKK